MSTVTATEPVYRTDVLGVRRLVAATGDTYDPDIIPTVGIVTQPDHPGAGIEPAPGYDELTEAEALSLLPDLSAEDLEALQAYERAHLARGSITGYSQVSKVVTSGAAAGRALDAAKKAALAAGDSTTPAPVSATVEVPTPAVTGGYDAMSATDLQAEADSRGLSVIGSGSGGNVLKKDLVSALQADDAKQD